MKFSSSVSVQWVAELIDASVYGNTDVPVKGINEIHCVEQGDLVFVDHPKYYEKALNSDASFIIINTDKVVIPEGKTIFVVDEPFEAYLKIVRHFKPAIHSAKAISETAIVGEGSTIMPNCFIGNRVTIGKHCLIHPNVTILDDTVIGDGVCIQAGTVIGGDAFYYNAKKDRSVWYKKMLSCGNVIIEDDVEIGACCTIDRGVTASTRIGKGSKLDNMVHVGHDVQVGPNCLIAAQAGIAGGTKLEQGVIIWGQVGINKTITIGENAVVLGQSGVTNSLEGNKTYFGTPAIPASAKRKEFVWIKRIPELWKKIMQDETE